MPAALTSPPRPGRRSGGSHLTGGDRVGEIRLGPDRLVFALRSDTGGSFSFELLAACPADDDCDAPAWEPVHSA